MATSKAKKRVAHTLLAHIMAARRTCANGKRYSTKELEGTQPFPGSLSWSLHEGRDKKAVSWTTALLFNRRCTGRDKKTISWTHYPTSWKGKPFPGPLRYLTSAEGRTISGATAHRTGRAKPFPGVTTHPSCKTSECPYCSGRGSY